MDAPVLHSLINQEGKRKDDSQGDLPMGEPGTKSANGKVKWSTGRVENPVILQELDQLPLQDYLSLVNRFTSVIMKIAIPTPTRAQKTCSIRLISSGYFLRLRMFARCRLRFAEWGAPIFPHLRLILLPRWWSVLIRLVIDASICRFESLPRRPLYLQ